MFADKNVLVDFFRCVAHNSSVSSAHANSYPPSVRMVFECLLTLGGPHVAEFVSRNFNGPHLDTIQRYRRTNRFPIDIGVCPRIFEHLARVYKNALERLNIQGPVPFLCAEDETPVLASVRWNHSEGKLTLFHTSHASRT